MDDLIYYDQSLNNDTCNTIINLFLKEKNMYNNYIIIDASANNENVWFETKNILINNLIYNIEQYYSKLNNDIFHFNISHKNSSVNKFVVINLKGRENFTNNSISNIIIDHTNKRKIINFLWVLNDIDNNVNINFLDYKIKPEIGQIILYPSDWFIPFSINSYINNDFYVIMGSIYINV